MLDCLSFALYVHASVKGSPPEPLQKWTCPPVPGRWSSPSLRMITHWPCGLTSSRQCTGEAFLPALPACLLACTLAAPAVRWLCALDHSSWHEQLSFCLSTHFGCGSLCPAHNLSTFAQAWVGKRLWPSACGSGMGPQATHSVVADPTDGAALMWPHGALTPQHMR